MPNPTCSIEGCHRPHYGRGWCNMHWTRWRKHGDPLETAKAPPGEPLSFIRRAQVIHTDDCILWPFGRTPAGYGSMQYDGRITYAHVVSCEMAHGTRTPDGREVAHSCNVRPCVNPKHLRFATRKENQADRLLHGTTVRGEQVHNAKLTADQAGEIKRRIKCGESAQSIAADYPVSETSIRDIRRGSTWAWLNL